MTNDSFENENNNEHKVFQAKPEIYREIYNTYYYTRLSSAAKTHVKEVVDQFLKDGIIGKEDFKEAALILFETQPTVGEVHSARQECLLSGEKFLASNIPDSIAIEDNKIKKTILLEESYLILYHYLSRYWAVREGADIALSPDEVLNLSYETICLSSKIIYLLQDKGFAAANEFETKLAPLKKEFTKVFQKISLDQNDNESNSNYFIKLLRRLNAIRLFWLWNRITLEAFILNMHNALNNFTVAATHLSWSLYLFLGCVHVTGVIQGYFEAKARVATLGISAEKAGLAHLKLRRDVLVNDVIWGFANLAGCFWLCGLGIYGSIGDLLTALLLVMDLRMNILRLQEEEAKFVADIEAYNDDMIDIIDKTDNSNHIDEETKETLEFLREYINKNNYDAVKYLLEVKFVANIAAYNRDMIDIINKTINDNTNHINEKTRQILENLSINIDKNNYDCLTNLLEDLYSEIQNTNANKNLQVLYEKLKSINVRQELYWQLKSIHARKEERANAWQDKKLLLYSDIFYAAFIIVAFVMLCSFYVAFASMTMPLMIGLIGAVSLAAATLVWRSANSYIETSSLKRDKNLIRQEYNDLISEFVTNHKKLSEVRKKQIYLSILDKGAQLCYKEEESRYKKMEVFRETANRLLIPGAIAMNFLFLPASFGGAPTFVFLFVGILVAAVIASFLIKKYYQPKNTKWQNDQGKESSKPCFISSQFDKVKDFLEDGGRDITSKQEKILKIIQENRIGNNKYLFDKLEFYPSASNNNNQDDGDYSEEDLLVPKRIN